MNPFTKESKERLADMVSKRTDTTVMPGRVPRLVTFNDGSPNKLLKNALVSVGIFGILKEGVEASAARTSYSLSEIRCGLSKAGGLSKAAIGYEALPALLGNVKYVRDENWVTKHINKLIKEFLFPSRREKHVLDVSRCMRSLGVMKYEDGNIGLCDWENGVLTKGDGTIIWCERANKGKLLHRTVGRQHRLMHQYQLARDSYNRLPPSKDKQIVWLRSPRDII
jgi:hypothetical protein